jgi:hypothetical protein
MAGGHHFPYPKWVWSPAGGWWPKPAAWKRDSVIFGAVAALALFAGFRYTEANTVRDMTLTSYSYILIFVVAA